MLLPELYIISNDFVGHLNLFFIYFYRCQKCIHDNKNAHVNLRLPVAH